MKLTILLGKCLWALICYPIKELWFQFRVRWLLWEANQCIKQHQQQVFGVEERY